jgi:Uri superfamily endonuclease
VKFSGQEAGAIVCAIRAEGHRVSNFEGLGSERGAYLLLIRLSCPVRLRSRTIERGLLAPGDYIYAGSAWGSGGIRARAGRHLKQRKRRHWHIDDVTEAADSVHPIAVPGGRECDLIQLLLTSGRFSIPVKGFGSSDCSRCDSHLLIAHESQEIEPTP